MKYSFPLRNQIHNNNFPRYQNTPSLSASQSTLSYFTRNNSNFNSTNNYFNSKSNSSRESLQFKPNKSYISTSSSLCRNKSALNKSQNSLKLNVDNKVEMINMRLRCDILRAKIENLKVRIPKHKEIPKNKQKQIKSKKNHHEEEDNLSNLADKLVNVFGLENNTNNIITEDNQINEELKFGELITDFIVDSGDVNSRNKYNDDMLYVLSESNDNEKKGNENSNKNNELDRIKVNILNALNETETKDTHTNNKNNNNITKITFREQGIQTNNDEYINELQSLNNNKNENTKFQPTVIETLPDFNKNNPNNTITIITDNNIATKNESTNPILNTEEEEDLIFSTIMENAKRMEEEQKNIKISEKINTINNIKQQQLHENKPPKKSVTFNEKNYRFIKYNEQETITKFTIYDSNSNKIKSKPINYKEYISFLRELSKNKKKIKPCIIGKFSYNKKQTTSKSNSQTKQIKSKSFKNLPKTKHKQPPIKKQPLYNNSSKHLIKKPQKRFIEDHHETTTNSQPPLNQIETPIAKVVGNIIIDILPENENDNNNTIQVKNTRKYSL